MRPRTRESDRAISKGGLTSVLLMLPLALLHLSCVSAPESPEPPQQPRRFLVGVVKGVYGKDFVIFKRSSGWMPAPGKALQWRPRDGEGKGGLLERSRERRGTLFVADIRSGSPAVGDLIYAHEIPGIADEATETIGEVPGESAQAEPMEQITANPTPGLESASELPPLRLPPEERSSSPRPTAAPSSATHAPQPPAASDLPPLRPPPD